MSSDNGIYLLKTKGVKSEFEYRAAYAMGIDNITANDAWDGNDLNDAQLSNGAWNEAEVINYFGKSKVYNNLDAAMCEAFKIEKSQSIGDYGMATEYGIVSLDFGDKLFPVKA